MSDWETASAKMDQEVDARLADTISYSTDGGATFVPTPGFILPFTESFGLGGIDAPLGSRMRVKIAKAILAAPLPTHRLTHPLLGADTWKPAGEDPDQQGRYWIFDIQKVAA